MDVAVHDCFVRQAPFELAEIDACFENADCVLLLTDHADYKFVDPGHVAQLMRTCNLFDTRHLLDHDAFCMVVKERELRTALDQLKRPPKLVVTVGSEEEEPEPPGQCQKVTVDGDTYVRKGSPNQNEGGVGMLRVRSSGSNRAIVR